MPVAHLTATPDAPNTLSATADVLNPGTYPGATTYPGSTTYPGRGNDLNPNSITPRVLTATVDT